MIYSREEKPEKFKPQIKIRDPYFPADSWEAYAQEAEKLQMKIKTSSIASYSGRQSQQSEQSKMWLQSSKSL